MKALVKTAPGPDHLVLADVPRPFAGPGQVAIRVAAGALCGTDVHIAHGTWPVRTPRILGHELAGTITEIGVGVSGLALGQRVTTETDASFCGSCAFCLAGDMQLCAERTGIGTSADGGFAEFAVLPARGVHVLPATVGLEAGALTEPLAVAVHAVIERGLVQRDERVAVMGPGSIGILAAKVARTQGADVTLVGLRRHEARFRLAGDLGIDRYLLLDDPAGEPAIDAAAGSMDAVVECSGAPASLARATRLLRKGGRLVLVGFYGAPVHLDLDLVIDRELSLVASRGKRPSSFERALGLMAAGSIDPARLITHRFPLSRWREAFVAAERPGAKVVLTMQEAGRRHPIRKTAPAVRRASGQRARA